MVSDRKNGKARLSQLHQKAEKTVRAADKTVSALTSEEIRVLIHDLNTHQIELEMQNEELRHAEKLAEEARDKYLDLYESAPNGYLTLSENGQILNTNLKAADLLGADRKALLDKRFAGCIRKEDRDIFYRHWKQILEGGLSQTCEVRLNKGTQTEFWVRIESKLSNITKSPRREVRLSLTDITEQKKATESLRGHQKLLSRIAENYPNSYVSVIDKDMRIVFSSGQEFVKKNIDPQQFLGLHIREVFGNKAQVVQNYYEKTFDGREQTFELYINQQNQLYRTVPLHAEDGSIPRILAVVENITDQKIAKRERMELQNQLVQAQKMEAIGTLAGGVAHDFNNILTAIKGNIQLALLKADEDHPLYYELNQIREASDRAVNLTRQLLLFSQKHPMNSMNFNINDQLELFMKLLRRIIGENILIHTELETGLWDIMGDKGNIEQVIMNIAVNAKDAMPGGGEIFIRTSNVDLTENAGQNTGKYACLSISDTGEGMDRETQQRVFEPFFTTKAVNKGTGLGMAVVFGIVKEYNGWIDVESETGKGTEFTIYLPAYFGRKKKVPTDQVAKPDKGSGETILILEDDPYVMEIAKRMLTKNGYSAKEAATCSEALALIANEKEHIDLLLSDIVLPDGNGVDVGEKALESRPDLPIIFVSGYPKGQINYETLIEKDFTFLQKPYNIHELLQNIREHLKSE